MVLGLSFSQAHEPPPAFLAEMSAKPRDAWSFEEVDSWISAAREALAASIEGRAREDVYRGLLQLQDWRSGIDKTARPLLETIRAYLTEFPDGAYREEFEWARVRAESFTCEYEGVASAAIATAQAYEEFLAGHPTTALRDDIELELAVTWHAAYEMLHHLPASNPGYSSQQEEEIHRRAHELLRGLEASSDESVAAEAAELSGRHDIYFIFPPRGGRSGRGDAARALKG